jgi:hypothetical protein
MKKCPPGVVCIENYSMFFVIICLFVVVYLAYYSFQQSQPQQGNTHSERIIIQQQSNNPFADPMLNPYSPPLKPLNMSTNIGAVDASYRQVGILTATNSKGAVMPLMGRPLFTNRDKWQYYSMNTNVKLPLSRNGRSCTNEYGCDQLFNGDTVFVEGVNEAYRVTVYDSDTMRYLPAL